jgi:hypothetical protein
LDGKDECEALLALKRGAAEVEPVTFAEKASRLANLSIAGLLAILGER